ncbi:MAG: DUF3575 domain-containing protein [Bacteroidales bacterium]|nr:DUF3575 domain-containing protein [Bacteroidales bacterium]
MLRDKIGIITCLACALCSLGAHAQPSEPKEASDSLSVYFRVSRTDLDPEFGLNREGFSPLSRRLEAVLGDTTFTITSVMVTGGASPEGSLEFNRQLSEERAKAIFDYFTSLASIPDSLMGFRYLGRDWQGLARMVGADPATPYQQEVLDLIKRGQTSQLKTLHDGIPYQYMYTHHFPTLRAAKLKLTYNRPLPPLKEMQRDTIVETVVVHDTVYVQVDNLVYYCPPCKPFYMSVRTNLVHDVLLTPNLGLEFYLGRQMSIGGNWHYAWWSDDSRHRYWRNYGGDLYFRYWIGRRAKEKPLSGHHLGLMASLYTYDYEWGGKGHIGGKPGHNLWEDPNYAFGVEYGYSLPIARRLNLDFTLGVGYIGGKEVEYEPRDRCYVWLKTSNEHHVGITKFEVSLVWLIGCDNYNRKKEGGKR